MDDPIPEDSNTYPQPLVSVVMPVRDQERVLGQTLESVLAQTLRNFELVLVDDGSADGSPAIEREFAGLDPRIRLFPRAAEGAAPARNFGLGEAAGRYVIFLDSDDLFHPDMLLDMASALEATGADICICEADMFFGSDHASFEDKYRVKPYIRINGYKEGLYSRHAFGRETFQIGIGAPWNKMYRRGFLLDTNILFQNTKRYNDSFFTTKAMWEADSVYLLKETLVLYRRGLGTSIQDRRLNYPQETILVAEKIFDDVDEKNAFSDPEMASLKLRCASLLTIAASDYLAAGMYSESIHKRLATALQHWGLTWLPRTRGELNSMIMMKLITRTTYDRMAWATAHWFQKTGHHTPLEKLDYASRIAVAIVLSSLTKT